MIFLAPMDKYLIIRLSSIGDIIQAMAIPAAIKEVNPNSEIHWVIKEEFQELLSSNPHINKVLPLPKSSGAGELLQLHKKLKTEKYTHIYDAHSNLRSHLLCIGLNSRHFLRRSKNRWKRFLLFKLKKNTFPTPFVAQDSFLNPLKKWGIHSSPEPPQLFLPKSKNSLPISLPEPYVALAPSAAWEMKTWPMEHFHELLSLNPNLRFVVLGGKEDHHLDVLGEHKNTVLLNGKLSIVQSCQVIAKASALISGDTGLLHAGDQIGVPLIALIGPTAFGFPKNPTSHVMSTNLDCRPCTKDGRGRCIQSVYKKCLVDISPTSVSSQLKEILN